MTTQLNRSTGPVPHPMQTAASSLPGSALADRFIYVAGPCTPMGGGMFKIAEYLIQSQPDGPAEPVLRMLETRGGGSAAWSPLFLARAVAALVRGRMSGRLAGVHVNMAERMSLVRKGIIMSACRLLGIPVVLHLHAAQLHHSYRGLPASMKALVRWMFSLPASCVVLGQAAAGFVKQELKVPPERVEIVVNGVPEPELPRRPAVAATPQILFLGNLSERKGVSDLLRAIAHPALAAAALRVSFAGGGDVDHYTGLAGNLGVADRVEFTGWADPATVARLLSQADVLVLPSYDEGLPLAILEGLAQGVAVVCTPVGEIPNVLTDGLNACFVKPGDSAGIARAIARLLGDQQLRGELERNGRALYEKEFSLPRFFANVSEIHQRQFGTSAQPPAHAEHTRP